jgi:hypothetical protein
MAIVIGRPLGGGLAASYVAASLKCADRVTEWTESRNWTESRRLTKRSEALWYGEELTE